MNQTKTVYFYWVLAALVCLLMIPILVQKGMFFDGVTYAAISQNLAHHNSTFWNPSYTHFLYKSFHEHPPLVFGIQSLFFSLLGDSYLTEKIYTLFTTFVTLIIIIKLWNLFFPEFKDYGWFSALLWIFTPVTFWACQNNLLENTMTPLSLLAVYYYYKSALSYNLTYLILGSLMVCLAFLAKGPVGVYPMASTALFFLVNYRLAHYRSLLLSVLSFILPVLLMMILFYSIPESLDTIKNYYDTQLVASLNGERDVIKGLRFQLLLDILLDFSLVICISLVLYFKFYKKKSFSKPQSKRLCFILLVALSASLPIFISPKQSKFYLTPSIPLFMMFFAGYMLPYFSKLFDRLSHTVLKNSSILLFTLTLVLTLLFFNTYSRNEIMLKDIDKLKAYFKTTTDLSGDNTLVTDWEAIANLQRHGAISVQENGTQNYFLQLKTTPSLVDTNYQPVALTLEHFILFKKKSTYQ